MTDLYQRDIDALARIGASPDEVDMLARCGMPVGAIATFIEMDRETRRLVLRLIWHPDDADFVELDARPDRADLSAWLLTLPAYVNVPEFDPYDEETW
jgi:hypothetical protein